MIRHSRKIIIFGFLILIVCVGQSTMAAEEFGRLFTTVEQRAHLDELRKIDPGLRIQVEDQTLLIEEDVEEPEEVAADTLTVRGLVYRGDGRSTAWVNNSNTYEGGLSSKNINIGKIESNNVEIKIPTADSSVKLNVGQSFDPLSESYKDLVEGGTSAVKNVRNVEE
ncbi:MAG: hypothetical protein ACI909_002993 [Planctomycetota bacterium]